MSKVGIVWQVAMRELRERGKSKAYLFTTVLTLLLVGGLIVLPPLFSGGTDEHKVGSVGDGNGEIVDAAERLANAGDDEGEEPSAAFTIVEYPTRADGVAALDEAEIDALLVDGSEVVVETLGFGGSGLLDLLQRGAATVKLEEVVAEQGQVAADVIEVMTSDPLETTTISGEDAQDDSRGLIAYAGLMLLYIAILLYGTWILTGVTEEKSNRVVEVLLSSLRPWQLLGGKILGIGSLGIAQFVGTIAVAYAALRFTGTLELPTLDPLVLLDLVLWFILGFLLFAVLFGAAGSLASRTEDAQNVAFPMSMIAVAGFFVSITALSDPTGALAVAGTFIPLTAPFVVPVRVALEAIPLWQFLAAILLTLAAIVGMVFVAGRIYAGAVLRYGGKIKIREAWRGAVE